MLCRIFLLLRRLRQRRVIWRLLDNAGNEALNLERLDIPESGRNSNRLEELGHLLSGSLDMATRNRR